MLSGGLIGAVRSWLEALWCEQVELAPSDAKGGESTGGEPPLIRNFLDAKAQAELDEFAIEKICERAELEVREEAIEIQLQPFSSSCKMSRLLAAYAYIKGMFNRAMWTYWAL